MHLGEKLEGDCLVQSLDGALAVRGTVGMEVMKKALSGVMEEFFFISDVRFR